MSSENETKTLVDKARLSWCVGRKQLASGWTEGGGGGGGVREVGAVRERCMYIRRGCRSRRAQLSIPRPL